MTQVNTHRWMGTSPPGRALRAQEAQSQSRNVAYKTPELGRKRGAWGLQDVIAGWKHSFGHS